MTTANFKTAIDILMSNKFDARTIAIELAKQHPSIFVKLATGQPTQTRGELPEIMEGWYFDAARMILRGERVAAIKAIRENTGYGLKEAKDISDASAAEMFDRGILTTYTASYNGPMVPANIIRQMVGAAKQVADSRA